MVFKPATPGFLVTLIATGLLAAVVFSVPYIKSVFFLQASFDNSGINGIITLGTLGYCLDIGAGPVCSKPSIGYEFDPNLILGITKKIEIPEVVVKWITYALVLHVVALVLAAGSAVFGLLAHVREFSAVCCSTCISGLGASIALIAFIFDLAFFFLVKARIKAIGGTATVGMAIWLTLAAWVLLFFAGCFYGFGRCCIRSRPRGPSASNKRYDPPYQSKPDDGYDAHAEQMRLDAVKAEADRKARQRTTEGGLPAFTELESGPRESTPLRPQYLEEEEEDDRHSMPYRDNLGRRNTGATAHSGSMYNEQPRRQPTMPTAGTVAAAAAAGYAAAPRGTRAVDDYYTPAQQPAPATSYPPQPRQYQNAQPSHAQMASHYPEIVQPQPSAQVPQHQYLAPAAAVGAASYASQGHMQVPSSATNYGHQTQQTSYHSAHSYFPSTYSQTPGPESQPQVQAGYSSGDLATGYNGGYPSSGVLPQQTPSDVYYTPGAASAYTANSYYGTGYNAQDGGGSHPNSYYSAGTQTPMPTHQLPNPYPQSPQQPMTAQTATSLPYAASPVRINTDEPPTRPQPARQMTSPGGPRGPRSPTSPTSAGWGRSVDYMPEPTHGDAPPGYDAGHGFSMPRPPEKS